jgi:hypothetical protein
MFRLHAEGRENTGATVVHLLLSRRGDTLALHIEQRVRHVNATLTEFAYCYFTRTAVP